MTTSTEMAKSLKDTCVPLLRKMGFKGSFPNFYRDDNGFVCLVNFQFNTLGEKFCINLGFADPERRNLVSHCRDIDARDLRISMTGGLIEGDNHLSGRWRVGSQPLGDGLYSDSWFSFARGPYGGDRAVEEIEPDVLAQQCATLIEQEAETWWMGRRVFAASVSGGG
jgi:hypothetical protein